MFILPVDLAGNCFMQFNESKLGAKCGAAIPTSELPPLPGRRSFFGRALVVLGPEVVQLAPS
jgi:hypothetical protein